MTEDQLKVGVQLRIGALYAAKNRHFQPGDIITLIEGNFERDNGLYTVGESAPSIWNERDQDYDSIFHLFGNDLEWFFDCEIVTS